MFWRLLPLGCVLTFIGLAVCWRMWSLHRRCGTFGVMLFRTGTLRYHVRDALLVVYFGIVTSEAILVALAPAHTEALGWLPMLGLLGRVCGLVLAIAATAALVIGQRQLGTAWRVGIDTTQRPSLRTDGFYAYCRNPIYVAWWIWTLGYTLLLPTWVSVVALTMLTLTIHWYVEEEERHLARVHGDAYRAYGYRVGRFLPGLHRFR